MGGHPGEKLLFMGQEFAQGREWDAQHGLDWHLLDIHWHKGVQSLVRDLNRAYRELPALHRYDCDGRGFEWIEANDAENSVYAWIRRGDGDAAPVLVVVNMTPQPHTGWRVGLPSGGRWRVRLNTDATLYGGSGMGNMGGIDAEETSWHGRPFSARITIPPLATVYFVKDN